MIVRLRRLARAPAASTRPCAGSPARWAGRADLAVRHVVGERDWEAEIGRRRRCPTAGSSTSRSRYEDDMPSLLAAADLVGHPGRARSTWPSSPCVGLPVGARAAAHRHRDHQTANAEALVDAGAAVLVPDAELDADRLVAEVDALLADPGRRAAMGDAAGSSAGPMPPAASPARAARAGDGARPSVPRRAAADRPRRPTVRCWPDPAASHIVGVGGAGMSAIATVLAAMGHQVTRQRPQGARPGLERLRALGVDVAVGHDADDVGARPSSWRRSTAIRDDNPEVVAARAAGCPVLRRAEVLAAIAATRPDRSRWPAPTARPRRRRCWPSSWSRPASTRRSSSAAT